jgi:hypothetical protein
MLLEIIAAAAAVPMVALGITTRIMHAQTSTELFAEVDDELIHRLWVALDGPNRQLVTDAQFWREIGGLPGLWRMWLQVRTMVGAINERAKETNYCTEASLANDDFYVAALISLREWFKREKKIHARACVRAFLHIAEQFDLAQTAVDLV